VRLPAAPGNRARRRGGRKNTGGPVREARDISGRNVREIHAERVKPAPATLVPHARRISENSGSARLIVEV